MDSAEAKNALDILDEAHGLSAQELEAYLDRVCGDDSLLRREVLDYLDYEVEGTVITVASEDGNTLEIPAARVLESRYELGDEIAAGGIGVILRAFDNNIRRSVAIKVLRNDWEDKPDVVRRFLQEAQIGGQLQHPGIPPVYEIGRLSDGRPFIAMKLVKGDTLEDLLAKRGNFNADHAEFLGIFEQICQAVAYAHTRGVIHRDLKPSNVMVGQFGEVQVMDWGIAKLLTEGHPEAPQSETPSHAQRSEPDPIKVDTDGTEHRTRVGQLMGTPAYMAPEQSIGRADTTADVFALGAILCEILTGEKTMGDAGDTSGQLDRCGCDQALVQLAKDCLQRNEADRPQNAGVVAKKISVHLNAIQARLQEAEIAAARAEIKADEERKRRRRTLWTIAGVAMLLGIVGTFVVFVRHSAYQRSLRERTEMAVTSLSTSHGTLVPHVIEDLQELPREMVLRELRQQFNDGDESRRFRLAYGLAGFGDVRVDLLVSKVATCSPDEVDNLVQALGNSSDEAVSALETTAQLADTAEDWPLKSRLAMLALQLGAPGQARQMCQPQADPIQRTSFIEECSSWYGNLSRLAPLAADVDDGPLRSALAIVVGSVPAAYQSVDDRQVWQEVLSHWYRMQPDTGSHSAAEWALRQWNLEIPTIFASKRPLEGRHWYVNCVGVTMLEFPAGSFIGERETPRVGTPHEFNVSRAFLLADRELTRAQFQQFIDDPEYPSAEKPAKWQGADLHNSPTEEHPVQNVTWVEAVLFCNWLSRQEELVPCYERAGQQEESENGDREYGEWVPNLDAGGYRLPTEAEWEYACRAAATTAYHFGEDESLLERYAVHYGLRTKNSAELPGTKPPNAWGLFDMHGNVMERCQDWDLNFRSAIYRHSGWSSGHSALRGGSFRSTPLEHRCSNRLPGTRTGRSSSNIGFRVARTCP